MEKRAKLEAVEKMLRELDDVKNSQISLLKKITQLEAENINVGVNVLDKALPDVHDHADGSVDTITRLIEELQNYRDDFAKKNNLLAAEEPTES